MKKKKRRKKRKLSIKKITRFIVIVLICALIPIIYNNLNKETISIKKVLESTKYLASSSNEIKLYQKNEDGTLDEGTSFVRGTKVKTKNKKETINEVEYVIVKIDDKEYYISNDYLKDNIKDVVLEKEKYIRTSVTVYKNEEDYSIESFIKKGNKIDIIDYDELDSSGNVNMYKIKYNDIEGWVYSKYLTDTEESSLANYNENGEYDTHKDRKYQGRELYGGSAATLDYYPYTKANFEDNKIVENAKAMYLNAGVIGDIDSYLEIAKSSSVNAIVVDIKDGALAYSSEVAKKVSKTAYDTAINDNAKYKEAIDKIKDAGIYVIGRIVVFNDTHYGTDHPEDCIETTSSSRTWPSAYSRGAWEYNVGLAIEAVELMGFNEIQFDYVRFPEDAYNMSISGNTDFKNKYDEEKAEAVQNFLFYAADQIHKTGAYLSVDVFGECSSEYVTAYGQYWPAISNIVDAISSMPYTDHFGRSVDTWTDAYSTVYNWAKGAAQRQTEIPTPAIARTWITAYDTPYWNPTVTYGASKIEDQANALVDAGLKGGFITWNSASSLAKYRQIQDAFSKTYE